MFLHMQGGLTPFARELGSRHFGDLCLSPMVR